MCTYTNWNIGPQKIQTRKIYNTRLWRRNMENEERAHHDAYFQEELDSLKMNMAHITSLLKQTLTNISGEGPWNQLMTFIQTQTTIQPEERMGDQSQESRCNTTFIQSTIHRFALIVIDAFTNKSHKIKFSKDVDYDKISTL